MNSACALICHFRIQGTQQRSGEILARLCTWQAVHAREIFDKLLTLQRVPPPGTASDLSRPRCYLFASALEQQGTPREGRARDSREGRGLLARGRGPGPEGGV